MKGTISVQLLDRDNVEDSEIVQLFNDIQIVIDHGESKESENACLLFNSLMGNLDASVEVCKINELVTLRAMKYKFKLKTKVLEIDFVCREPKVVNSKESKVSDSKQKEAKKSKETIVSRAYSGVDRALSVLVDLGLPNASIPNAHAALRMLENEAYTAGYMANIGVNINKPY